MQLLPLSLCLLTLTGSTFSDGNGPEIIKVTEGDDVTLPCNINKNILSERFEWTKDGKKDVYLYEGTQLSGVDEQFRDRVSHFGDDKLRNGNASITISDTKVSDTGVYTCDLPKFHQTFTVRLLVDPVTKKVKEGDDVTLPCYIKNKDILEEQFVWKKDGEKEVYLYLNRAGHLSGQDKEFRGRVSHVDHELRNGNASIIIRNTTVDDTGVYTCDFPKLQPKQTFTVRLVVGAFSKPHITILQQKEGKVPLQCEVSDASPGFKLNISWFNKHGTQLNHTQIEATEKGKTYVLQTAVTKSDTYCCNATMEEISHQVQSETYVHVPDQDLKDRTSEVKGKAAKVSILKPEQSKDGVLLQCEVSDASPGFKLNISWFDGSGNKLTEQMKVTESEEPSILQTTVTKSDTYRCVATMEELSHRVHSEVHVHIPGSNLTVIIVSVVLVLILVAVVVGLYIRNLKKNMKRGAVTIKVTEGSDAILPCYINKNILSERFEWKKDGEKVVYLYEGGPLSGQDDQFKGRVSHFGDDKLKNGDASITISDTKVSDSGVYTCDFPNLLQTFTVRLDVDKRSENDTDHDKLPEGIPLVEDAEKTEIHDV